MSFGYVVSETDNAHHWWTVEDETDCARSIFHAFRRIEDEDRDRIEDYKRFVRIYENRDYLGLSPRSYVHKRADGKSTYNISKLCVDTIAARIAKSRPHGRVQTTAGNESLRRRARLQERWVEAEQYRSNMEREAPDVFLDAAILGTGIFRHYKEDGRIKSERVFPGEVFVDQVEAFEGKPMQWYRRKWIPRVTVMEKYGDTPEKERAIEDAKSEYPEETWGRDSLSDQVEVVEAWFCSGKNGKHAVAIDGCLLGREKWTWSTPNFTFMFWDKPRRGFWGQGLIEQLIPLHIDINLTLQQIQKNVRFGNFQAWIDYASRIKGQKLTNEIGAINHYRGQPPHFVTLDPVSQNLVQHLANMIERALQISGISMDSAMAKNTLGADASGVSRRAFYERETLRYALVEALWEWMWMDTHKMYVRLGKELSKEIRNYKVVADKDRYTIEELDWRSVDIDDDSYVIRVAPVSALPSLPSDRLATVNDLYLMGIIDPATALQMLDWPDLDEHVSLARATRDNLERIVEKLLDEGKYEPPSPFQDHQLALKTVQAHYERARARGNVPEERLKLLRTFMAQTHQMMLLATAAQQGTMNPAAPGVPPAPGPTGQSPTAVTPTDGTILQ